MKFRKERFYIRKAPGYPDESDDVWNIYDSHDLHEENITGHGCVYSHLTFKEAVKARDKEVSNERF